MSHEFTTHTIDCTEDPDACREFWAEWYRGYPVPLWRRVWDAVVRLVRWR